MRLIALIAAIFVVAPAGAQSDPPALAPRIAREAARLRETVIAQRRDFHMHPELSNRETRTADVIAKKLRALGFDEVKTGIAKTGVVGILKGGKPGPVVAWRADMDALPVTSELATPHKSQNVGVHHACGHDGHMAIALGVAELLSGMRAEIPGTVKFIFQPAEEGPPAGEEGGAMVMVREGALKNPDVGAIFGLHLSTWMEGGKIGVRNGPLMASADTFDVTIRGKQVHGAMPHDGVDTIVVAAECLLALQTIRSRRIDPLEPMVLTIGAFHAGNRHNIIPGEAKLDGTLRTFSEGVRESVRTMMRQTLTGCTSTHGASFELKFRDPSYPVTSNNEALSDFTIPMLRNLEPARVETARQTTGAEDFSYFQKEVPGFFWFLGASNKEKGMTAAHHTPKFDIDEAVLETGVRVAATQLVHWLESGGRGRGRD